MATYYVRTDGSDSNSGTSNSAGGAWATVQKACNTVTAGDVVNIETGTYAETPTMATSGSVGNLITFQKAPGASAIIDGGTGTHDFNAHTFRLNGSYVKLDGLEIKRGRGQGVYITGQSCTVTRCLVHTIQNTGIYCYYGYTPTITFNTIHDCFEIAAGGNSDGITVTNNFEHEPANATITDNVIYNISDDGIDVFTTQGNTIARNVVYNCGPSYVGSASGNGNGIKCGPGGNNTVTNNAIANCQNIGLAGNEGPGTEFYNNTVYNCTAYNVANWGAGTGCTYSNNISYTGSVLMDASPTQQTNTWNLGITNPQFVSTDPVNANFLRLSAGSPAIDVGTDVGLSYNGSAPDLGAYEFSSTATLSISVTDLVTVVDTTTLVLLSGGAALAMAVSDAVAVAESVSVQLSALQFSVFDSITVTENIGIVFYPNTVLSIATSESITVSETSPVAVYYAGDPASATGMLAMVLL